MNKLQNDLPDDAEMCKLLLTFWNCCTEDKLISPKISTVKHERRIKRLRNPAD
jgi:hypothetical protein